MPELGYALSSEEHGPTQLVRNAARAEQAGFSFALVSDHFHPWIDRQGESPVVWSVIGAIATTTNLRVGTGVTCPLIRTHPVAVAGRASRDARGSSHVDARALGRRAPVARGQALPGRKRTLVHPAGRTGS